MPLTFADAGKTQRFEDGDVWIELRTELTKHDADVLAEVQQGYRMDPNAFSGDADADRQIELRSRIVEANRRAFALLCVGWSVGPDKPTSDDYDRLDAESGAWVDECIGKVLTARKRAEGNAPRSRRKRASSRAS